MSEHGMSSEATESLDTEVNKFKTTGSTHTKSVTMPIFNEEVAATLEQKGANMTLPEEDIARPTTETIPKIDMPDKSKVVKTTAAMSLKRLSTLTPPHSPPVKRTKEDLFPGVKSSASPRPDSTFARRLANAQRRIQQAKSQRVEIETKKSEVEKSIAPFLQQLEKLEAEAAAEELRTKTAEKSLQDSLEYLKDLQSSDM